MNTALIILALLLAVVGIVGSVVPMLPGPPLSWVGLLLISLHDGSDVSTLVVVIAAVVCLVVSFMDYYLPGRLTKRFGGGKAGFWGCNIGLLISIVGAPFGPTGLVGVIFWPFAGALVGELISQHQFKPALKSAFGSFVGFLSGTLIKLVYSIMMLVLVIIDCF